jgi:hypothetical protein
MYTVCTFRLTQIIEAPYLAAVPRVALYVALAAWTLTMAGLVRSLATAGQVVRSRRQ